MERSTWPRSPLLLHLWSLLIPTWMMVSGLFCKRVSNSLIRLLLADEPTPSTATKGVLTAERAAAVSRVAKVKALTQADIDSRKYSIFDVVLPMPGFAVTYPVGALGDKYREIMKSDKIDMDDMFRKQKEYSLVRLLALHTWSSRELMSTFADSQGGTYRKIMHLPKDVTHKLITYTSSTQDLAQSDEDVLLGKPAPEVSLFNPDEPLPEGHTLGLQLEITLGSSTCTSFPCSFLAS